MVNPYLINILILSCNLINQSINVITAVPPIIVTIASVFCVERYFLPLYLNLIIVYQSLFDLFFNPM
ncbi:hypothetical protein [Staphylococcus phage vB_SauM-V1SA20]|nr:hypothetical protein [Staphylococcus phage vB_SauM-V1SA20]